MAGCEQQVHPSIRPTDRPTEELTFTSQASYLMTNELLLLLLPETTMKVSYNTGMKFLLSISLRGFSIGRRQAGLTD
jgi:hypothetical protein